MLIPGCASGDSLHCGVVMSSQTSSQMQLCLVCTNIEYLMHITPFINAINVFPCSVFCEFSGLLFIGFKALHNDIENM